MEDEESQEVNFGQYTAENFGQSHKGIHKGGQINQQHSQPIIEDSLNQVSFNKGIHSGKNEI